jgi:hypothetical protein
MFRKIQRALTAGVVVLVATIGLSQPNRPRAGSLYAISVHELRDKIEGGWAGQMIGVSYGAPTEFRYREAIIPEDRLPAWKPENVTNALNQDDLYVDMTFAAVLDTKGLGLHRGVRPPLSRRKVQPVACEPCGTPGAEA